MSDKKYDPGAIVDKCIDLVNVNGDCDHWDMREACKLTVAAVLEELREELGPGVPELKAIAERWGIE